MANRTYSKLVMVKGTSGIVRVEGKTQDDLDDVVTCVSLDGCQIADHQVAYVQSPYSATEFELTMRKSSDCDKFESGKMAELVYLRGEGVAIGIANVPVR